MYPEMVKIKIEDEIDGFQRTVLEKLLNSFHGIEAEAAEKRKSFFEYKAVNFNPETDDEGCIEEDAYFEELNHIFIEQELKQEFLNSTAVWLFHLFERQKKRVFDSAETDTLKPNLASTGYALGSCQDWLILNEELRMAANTIKHGNESDAAKKLQSKYPSLIDGRNIKLSSADVERYLGALRGFWQKALDGKVVL